MSTMVGKKFKHPCGLFVEILQELEGNELLCKNLDAVIGKIHIVQSTVSIVNHWKEVRKPRVVYINKWDGGIGWGSVWDNPNDALFQKGSRTDVKTIKFIEVLD